MSDSDIKIVLPGAAGRMGRTLIAEIAQKPDLRLIGATEPAGSSLVGTDAGTLAGLPEPLGVAITDDPLPLVAEADAIIDFTVPAATAEYAALAAQARIVHVIATTGFDAGQEAQIEAAARHATIIKAGNMSLGVNLLTALTRKVAQTLDADWDIEILEMHHRHKVDAPSGTALMLGKAAAEGRGINHDRFADRGRDGITGERTPGDIGYAVLRGGSVVGEHSAIFAAENERIVLSHIAEDRGLFARGALAAARWGQGKGPGLFSMLDVLGLSDF
ncbi:MAG: 4-hydroxy-tetrahydrodipicolinate reductase [Parvibaculaceae bacterium]|nr:4-hydroxy-tetrahydrodipicolinate reductase [Parvibaculaceae bacterium]HBM88632.1 4-hydroxy-tetrahydrodipicolinate reductase [Rhodobiaceae bacterium]